MKNTTTTTSTTTTNSTTTITTASTTTTITCSDGFDSLNGRCVDKDECKAGLHDCDFNADCVNTSGGFKCSCRSGFEENGAYCDDINECQNENACGLLFNGKMNCENTLGSYSCSPSCNEGFKLDGNQCINKPLGCDRDIVIIRQAMTKCWMRTANVRGGRTKFRICFKVNMTLRVLSLYL